MSFCTSVHVSSEVFFKTAILQMDSKDLDNNMESIADEPEEKLLSPCSVDISDIFGEPQVLPRVGPQYQADIPPLILKYDCLQLVNETTHSEILDNIPNCVSLESIPIMWANIEFENINGTVEFDNSEESQITSNDEHAELKGESLDPVLHNGQDVVGQSNFQSTTKSDPMDVDLILTQDSKAKLDQPERGPCPLPDSVGESWTQNECESFLLGLYIFGKNLNLVKRFVESKAMGDILSFYYGKFYRSDGYRRWSECRKLRSRRFVHGQKIFTGWRQQELFSRLFSHVPEECRNMLLEVFSLFFFQITFPLHNTHLDIALGKYCFMLVLTSSPCVAYNSRLFMPMCNPCPL